MHALSTAITRAKSAKYSTMAMIYWLEEAPATHVAGARTFRYCGDRADVIEVDSIKRPTRMATSPRQHNGAAQFTCCPTGKQTRACECMCVCLCVYQVQHGIVSVVS